MTYDELADYCKEASKTISEIDCKNRMLDKENQELKEKIKKLSKWDVNKDTRNSRQRVANAKLLKENQELKKQLEENKNPLREIFAQVNDDTLLRNCGAMQSEINGYKTQQKEFIKYLEDEIERKRLNATCTTEYNDYVMPLKVILQKYKKITGVSDENNKQ